MNLQKSFASATGISIAEVDWFLLAVTSITALDLRIGFSQPIESLYSVEQLDALWSRRLQERLPIQYLVGQAPWRNFELTVTPDVLIPRPETEYLIDLAKDAVQNNPLELANRHWVDLGTGSGAIALGLAEAFPEATVHAVDQSAQALKIAHQNAQKYQLSSRILFYQGSWWEPLDHLKDQVAGMISNPPYIPSSMLPDLQPEIYKHEPHAALDGGEDGLDSIRALVRTAPAYLVSGGIWLIEMMLGQGERVAHLLADNGNYEQIQVIDDFSGCDRYVLARRV